jgi:hypothetical protein
VDDLALAEHGDLVGDGEGGAQVLLDEMDGHGRGEAVGGLVEQEQPRVEEQPRATASICCSPAASWSAPWRRRSASWGRSS